MGSVPMLMLEHGPGCFEGEPVAPALCQAQEKTLHDSSLVAVFQGYSGAFSRIWRGFLGYLQDILIRVPEDFWGFEGIRILGLKACLLRTCANPEPQNLKPDPQTTMTPQQSPISSPKAASAD